MDTVAFAPATPARVLRKKRYFRDRVCSARNNSTFAQCSLQHVQHSRRTVLRTGALLAAGALLSATSSVHPVFSEQAPLRQGVQSRTGLKYIDFEKGKGRTPEWGDFVNFKYVAYTITENGTALRKEDQSRSTGYLIHHGNGQTVLGIEEALHSMAAGAKRRVIVPPNLAYVNPDLGPIPQRHSTRKNFSKHLQETGGAVVFDLELVFIMKDDDDRGYYQDLTPTDDELMEMMKNVQREYLREHPEYLKEHPDTYIL